MSTFVEDLAAALPAEALISGAKAAAFAVDSCEPAAAALPDSVEQVQAVMKIAARHGIAVCPIGAGMHLGMGAPPSQYQLALCLRRLCRVLRHQPEEMVVSAEAGTAIGALQDALAPHRQWLPLASPHGSPAAETPTLGGLLAADPVFACRLGCGGIREHVIGLRAVLADGTVIRAGGSVMKNVAGYDLCRLFTGSLGTLGVIVEATFRVRPLPEVRRTLVIHCDRVWQATEVIDRIAASELEPLLLEMLNAAAWRHIGQPDGWGVVAAFDGSLEVAAWQVAQARELLQLSHVAVHELPPSQMRRTAAVLGGGGIAVPGKVVCRVSALSSELPGLIAALEPDWPVCAQALLGMARVLLPADDTAPECVARLREQAAQVGGTCVVESAPAMLKPALDIWGPPRPDFRLMRAMKERFDPQGILSPGRFVGGL